MPGAGLDSLQNRDDQPLGERRLAEVEHLRETFFSQPVEHGLDGHRLDYHGLGGPGLERLCFLLLLADGRNPRFFGKPGDAQYGIDLLVDDGRSSIVYQCKNLARYSRAKLVEALAKFADEWLTRPHLRRPDRFVLCCPLELRRQVDSEDWQGLMGDFADKHRVAIEFWHRDTLDGWLRHKPDVVADLFSERIAEQFCDLPDWNQGLFRPVKPGSGERRAIERFIELRSADRIVRDAELAESFAEILAEHKLVLMLGLSGSGKTMTTLDLATSVDGGAWRVFFVSLRHETSEDHLVAGIERRSVRPTIFVLDDAHLDLDLVERVVERLRPVLRDRRVRLAVTAQPPPEEAKDMPPSLATFVERCEDEGQVLRLAPTLEQYAAIVDRASPALRRLSRPRLERLYQETARDLVLLDAVVESVSDPAELDAFEQEALFRAALQRYFRTPRPHAPSLKRVAALAQFDLAVPLAELPSEIEPKFPRAVQRLTAVDGRPPSLTFVHASAAELVFRALSWNDADPSWIECAKQHIVTFLLSAVGRRPGWERDLLQLLRGRLRLTDDLALKEAIVADRAIVERLATAQQHIPFQALSLSTFLSREAAGTLPYASWLRDRIEKMVAEPQRDTGAPIWLIGKAIRALSLVGGGIRKELEDKLRPENVLELLDARGTVVDLFKLLENSTPGFAEKLLDALRPDRVRPLVQRTLDDGRSIGTLSLALRDLGKRRLADGSGRTQLHLVEDKLGPENVLELLDARGTLGDLFKLLENSTPGFAEKLLDALRPDRVRPLVQRTLDDGRSIGTLSLALRDLGKRRLADGSGRTQLHLLEDKLGSENVLELLDARGTVVELFRMLKYSTLGFAEKLLDALRPDRVRPLVQRTLDEGRPIGTLHLVLRDLGKRRLADGSGRTQLHLLEDKLGSENVLELLDARGTVVGLFKLLENSTPDVAEKLLDALRPARVRPLVQRTLDEGRSIGTLHLALRDLGKRRLADGSGRTQLHLLEDKLGSENVLELLGARGNVVELCALLKYSTAGFAEKLLDALRPARVRPLVQRTLDEGRSIGTLHLALRDLGKRRLADGSGRTQLHLLEDKLGSENVLELLDARGNVVELCALLKYSTLGFAEKLLDALRPARVRPLVQRTLDEGRSIGTLNLALRELGKRHLADGSGRTQLHVLEGLLSFDDWWRLITENGDPNHLAYILDDLSDDFRDVLLAPGEAPSREGWEKLLRRGGFYAACRFARDSLRYLPEETLQRFRQAAIEAGDTLFENQDWPAIGSGLSIQPKIADATLRDVLRAAADRFLDGVVVSELAFSEFSPAVSAIACLWRERPARRAELAARLWDLLPPSHRWPEDDRVLATARFLLAVGRSADLPHADALRILRAFCPLPRQIVLKKTYTLTLFLFLWSLFALWLARGRELSSEFGDLQPASFWEELLALLGQRSTRRLTNQDKLTAFAFAGLLAFLLPDRRAEIRDAVRLSGVSYLRVEAESLTFVPAFFAYHGLSLHSPFEVNFTPERCTLLLRKAAEYEEIGPAVELLCREVRHWQESDAS